VLQRVCRKLPHKSAILERSYYSKGFNAARSTFFGGDYRRSNDGCHLVTVAGTTDTQSTDWIHPTTPFYSWWDTLLLKLCLVLIIKILGEPVGVKREFMVGYHFFPSLTGEAIFVKHPYLFLLYEPLVMYHRISLSPVQISNIRNMSSWPFKGLAAVTVVKSFGGMLSLGKIESPLP
jgi:hypothetical protein